MDRWRSFCANLFMQVAEKVFLKSLNVSLGVQHLTQPATTSGTAEHGPKPPVIALVPCWTLVQRQ